MTQKFSFLILMFGVLVALPTLAREAVPEAVKAGVPAVEDALMAWKEAVEGGDAEAIVRLYDKKAVMISTFVQKPITSREALLGYYKKVVANPDVRVEVDEEYPRKFGNMAVNSGTYTLSYTQEGEDVVVPARYSFMYQLQGKKWVIVDHHSSAVPMPVKE